MFVMSVRLSTCIIAAPIGRISVKFYINGLVKICGEKPDLVKIRQKCRALYVRTQVRFIVPGDIKSPLKCSVRVNNWDSKRV